MQSNSSAFKSDPHADDQLLPPSETVIVTTHEIFCDGAGDISPALGHPRIYMTIPAGQDHADCGYCDRRFLFKH